MAKQKRAAKCRSPQCSSSRRKMGGGRARVDDSLVARAEPGPQDEVDRSSLVREDPAESAPREPPEGRLIDGVPTRLEPEAVDAIAREVIRLEVAQHRKSGAGRVRRLWTLLVALTGLAAIVVLWLWGG